MENDLASRLASRITAELAPDVLDYHDGKNEKHPAVGLCGDGFSSRLSCKHQSATLANSAILGRGPAHDGVAVGR